MIAPACPWLLDSLIFSHGPMQMTLNQYVTEIGAGYFVIPIITVGLGTSAAWPKQGAIANQDRLLNSATNRGGATLRHASSNNSRNFGTVAVANRTNTAG